MEIRIEPDKQKAKSLRDMSLVTLERLRSTDKEKYPSNTLKDYYDAIKELMEAINFLDGVKMKGDGAHYETIDLICRKYKLGDDDREFLQGMRDYRNRIAYEGFAVKANYIRQNSKKIEAIIERLVKLLDKKTL